MYLARKDAKPQRNSGPFLSATADKPDYPQMGQLPLDKGDGGIYSRKGAETQRNCSQLGMTFRRGGLASLLCCLPRRITGRYYFLLFFSQ
jgi:hypothetical protein